VPERLRLFLQVARAVAYAHAHLVVHRDLKPSNVLVTADGQTHLLDFGIAKLLHESALGDDRLTLDQGRVLTPHYASPEQLRGEPITVASDVYSLGVLLYELLTERLPYTPERKSLAALEAAVLEGEPPLASSRAQTKTTAKALRGELDAILAKALRREPAHRYSTADALAEDIERHLSGERVLARPDSLSYRLAKAMRRHRAAFAAAGAVLLAVLGGAAMSMVQARRAGEAAERAQVVKEFVVDVFKVNERGSAGNAELRQLPAELLLEHGAKLIETKFPGQPQLQAELFGVVAGIFADMGASELAADYATHQVETLVAIDASQYEVAKATILLAQALFAQERLRDAEVRARRAETLAEPYSDLHPQALVLQARVLEWQGKNEEAIRVLDAVEHELKSGIGPTSAGARAKAVRAVLMAKANHFDASLPLFLSAIDEALAAEGPLSPTAISIRTQLSRALVVQDRGAEARPYRDAALAAMRASGGAGDIRAALTEASDNQQMFMTKQIPFDEARAAIERDRSAIAARGPLVPDTVKAWIDFDLGSAYVLWGNVELAEPLISSSASTLRPRTEALLKRFELSVYQGALAMFAGRHDQADIFLRERLEVRKLLDGGRHPFAAYDYAYIALNLGMQGRLDEAEAVLASAPEFEAIKGAAKNPLEYRQAIHRALARIRLERGDPVFALAQLPPESSDEHEWSPPFDDRLLRGEILCALGRRAEGLALMNASIEEGRAHSYQHHPELTRARAAAGLCALADGQRKRAEELAAEARASFVVQPDVSPYFKRPSERLDRLLGVAAVRR
jgi:hypothetical protein